MLLFIDWFNRVWKRPPNDIAMEMKEAEPNQSRIARLGAAMSGHLDTFEAMLSGRDFLMGDAFSAADCAAFPFLKFGLLGHGGSTHMFHQVLVQWQPIGDRHPRLSAWIRRLNELPRA